MIKKLNYKPAPQPLSNNERGAVSLDFTNEKHAAFFLERFGGEEHVKTHYPLVYQAFLKTQQMQERQQQLLTTSDPDFIPLVMNLTEITTDTSSAVHTEPAKVNHEEVPVITSDAIMHFQKPIPFASMIGYLNNVTCSGLLDSFAVYYENEDTHHYEQPLMYPEADVIRFDDQELESNVEYYYITADGMLGARQSITRDGYVCRGGSSFVSQLTLQDPISEHNNNPLIVLYGRTEQVGEHADYSNNDIHETDHKINMKLPISGTIKFTDKFWPVGYATGSHSANINLYFSDNGTITYKHGAGEFPAYFTQNPTDEHALDFKLDPLWNNQLDTSNLTVKTELKLECSFFVRVKDGKGETAHKFDVPIVINSISTPPAGGYYTAMKSTTVHLPYISARWGCFGRYTRIRMADGSDKKICDIQVGELLRAADGRELTVYDIITGPDASIIEIQTEDGKSILLSESHPIATAAGNKIAAYITTADELILPGGGRTRVKFAFVRPYNDIVYNLNTGGAPAMLIANGLVAGDYAAQCETSAHPASTHEPFSPEALTLAHEMARMMEETFS